MIRDDQMAKDTATIRSDGQPRQQFRLDGDLDTWVRIARSGESPDVAAALLSRFVERVDAGEAVDSRLLRYLAAAVKDMFSSGGIDLARPLGLKRANRGRPPSKVSQRNPLTPDGKVELFQRAADMFADGHLRATIAQTLSREPVVPARPAKYAGEQTIRDMLTTLSDIPRRVLALETTGVTRREAYELISRETDFCGVDAEVCSRIHQRLLAE